MKYEALEVVLTIPAVIEAEIAGCEEGQTIDLRDWPRHLPLPTSPGAKSKSESTDVGPSFTWGSASQSSNSPSPKRSYPRVVPENRIQTWRVEDYSPTPLFIMAIMILLVCFLVAFMWPSGNMEPTASSNPNLFDPPLVGAPKDSPLKFILPGDRLYPPSLCVTVCLIGALLLVLPPGVSTPGYR